MDAEYIFRGKDKKVKGDAARNDQFIDAARRSDWPEEGEKVSMKDVAVLVSLVGLVFLNHHKSSGKRPLNKLVEANQPLGISFFFNSCAYLWSEGGRGDGVSVEREGGIQSTITFQQKKVEEE